MFIVCSLKTIVHLPKYRARCNSAANLHTGAYLRSAPTVPNQLAQHPKATKFHINRRRLVTDRRWCVVGTRCPRQGSTRQRAKYAGRDLAIFSACPAENDATEGQPSLRRINNLLQGQSFISWLPRRRSAGNNKPSIHQNIAPLYNSLAVGVPPYRIMS